MTLGETPKEASARAATHFPGVDLFRLRHLRPVSPAYVTHPNSQADRNVLSMSVADRSPVIDAHAALDAVVQGIAIATRDGAQVGLTHVNAALCQLTGYDRAEFLRNGLQLLAGPNN